MPQRLTMADLGKAQHLSRSPDLAQAATHVRRSFHSLIGDLWLSRMLSGHLDSTAAAHEVAPIWFLLNEQIPVPNRHTILAWTLLCETGFSHFGPDSFPRMVLPQSILPMFFNEQGDTHDRALEADSTLPRLRTLLNRTGPEMKNHLVARKNFYRNDSYVGADLYSLTPKRATRCTRAHWHHDGLLFSDESTRRELTIRRLAIMSGVLTPIYSPTSAAAVVSVMGTTLTPLTRHGLFVKSDKNDSNLNQNIAWLDDGAPVRIDSSKRATQISSVPAGTPHLWLGFSSPPVVTHWLDAYLEHRTLALNQVKNPDLSGSFVTGQNPNWRTQLTEAGLVVDSKPEASKTERQVRQATAEAMLAGFTF